MKHTLSYGEITAPYRSSLRMVREAIETIFGPETNLESEEAELLRGPEPHHTAEAVIAALQNIAAAKRASDPDLLALAYQYRDDLRHPPTPDSRERRLSAIEAVLSKAGA